MGGLAGPGCVVRPWAAACSVARLFSGRRRGRRCRAGLLGAPVGDGPPARKATREPSARSDRSRSPARPCRRPRAPRPGLVVHAVPPAPSRQQGLRVLLECSARLCRRPWAPRPGPAVPPVPLVPSKQQGIGVSSRSPARPCRRPRAPRPGPVVHEVPPAPSGQQGLRVLLECSARPCRCPRAPQSGRAVCSARHDPRFSLFLIGVTPLSGALHQLGGGVMPPNWCNPP